MPNINDFSNPLAQKFECQLQNTEEVEAKLKGLAVSGRITTTTAPVQYEGSVDGYFLYFRARGNSWKTQICPTEGDLWTEKVVYSKEGIYGGGFDATWMPHQEALELIAQCVEEFRNQSAMVP